MSNIMKYHENLNESYHIIHTLLLETDGIWSKTQTHSTGFKEHDVANSVQ